MWMAASGRIDGGRESDWGRASADYARHRPGPPESFYARLAALGIGLPGQDVLDIATGTGHLARRFARAGCRVTATDIAEGQVAMARELAKAEGVAIAASVAPAEAQPVGDASQDVVGASQCWIYFDAARVLDEVARVLRPGGHLVICHFSFLPRLDPVAAASEALVLKHNPDWTGADWDGVVEPRARLDPRFVVDEFFVYDETIPFTRESWRGRMRALRGIAASLSAEAVAAFDAEHAAMLEGMAGESFTVLHRIDAHLLRRS